MANIVNVRAVQAPIRNLILKGNGGTATIKGRFVDRDGTPLPVDPAGNVTEVTLSVTTTAATLVGLVEALGSGTYTIPGNALTGQAVGFIGEVTVNPVLVSSGAGGSATIPTAPADLAPNVAFDASIPTGPIVLGAAYFPAQVS